MGGGPVCRELLGGLARAITRVRDVEQDLFDLAAVSLNHRVGTLAAASDAAETVPAPWALLLRDEAPFDTCVRDRWHSAASMDDRTRRRLLRATIGEELPGGKRVKRWTLEQVAERAGLSMNATQRGLETLRAEDVPPVWGDVDTGTGEQLWWMLPTGLEELDRLEEAGPS